MFKFYTITDGKDEFFKMSFKNVQQCHALKQCAEQNDEITSIPITNCSLLYVRHINEYLCSPPTQSNYWSIFSDTQLICCLEAAKYLICDDALISIGKEIIQRINGKTAREIAKILNLPDDMSSNEIEKFENEYSIIKK
jgi:hypothetical protein